MLPEKLTTQYVFPMHLAGEFYRTGAVVEMGIDTVVCAEDQRPVQGDRLHPGDKVVITTKGSVSPDRDCFLGCIVNPQLYQCGLVSAPSYIGVDYSGPIVLGFECWYEMDLAVLSYIIKLFTYGKLNQGDR